MIDWVSVSLLVIPSYFFQTFLHEGAHALFAIAHDMRITSFKIWPHYITTSRGTQRLYWGRVTYVRNRNTIDTAAERAWRSISPITISLPIWTFVYLTKTFWGGFAAPTMTTILVFWTAMTIDLVRGLLQSVGKLGDLNRAAYYAGVPKLAVRLVAVPLAFALAAGWFLYVWPVIATSL